MPTLASVCSTGDRLQMVKISKRSIRKLKSYEHLKIFPLGHSGRPGLKLARVTFHGPGLKLVSEVSPRPELHFEALRKIFRPPRAEQ